MTGVSELPPTRENVGCELGGEVIVYSSTHTMRLAGCCGGAPQLCSDVQWSDCLETWHGLKNYQISHKLGQVGPKSSFLHWLAASRLYLYRLTLTMSWDKSHIRKKYLDVTFWWPTFSIIWHLTHLASWFHIGEMAGCCLDNLVWWAELSHSQSIQHRQ